MIAAAIPMNGTHACRLNRLTSLLHAWIQLRQTEQPEVLKLLYAFQQVFYSLFHENCRSSLVFPRSTDGYFVLVTCLHFFLTILATSLTKIMYDYYVMRILFTHYFSFASSAEPWHSEFSS